MRAVNIIKDNINVEKLAGAGNGAKVELFHDFFMAKPVEEKQGSILQQSPNQNQNVGRWYEVEQVGDACNHVSIGDVVYLHIRSGEEYVSPSRIFSESEVLAINNREV